uniref:Ribosomal silencing factor RsfS n=1 Tax=Plectus sambesii TaxID=2011161 RepID=A0A914V450_9BILA
MVICSCFNFRHIEALAETVHKLYKQKRGPKDPPLTVAGGNDKHWRAIDMGNILLHIMTEKARQKYDLEQLWSVGVEFDQLSEQQQTAVEYDWLAELPPPRSPPAAPPAKRRLPR